MLKKACEKARRVRKQDVSVYAKPGTPSETPDEWRLVARVRDRELPTLQKTTGQGAELGTSLMSQEAAKTLSRQSHLLRIPCDPLVLVPAGEAASIMIHATDQHGIALVHEPSMAEGDVVTSDPSLCVFAGRAAGPTDAAKQIAAKNAARDRHKHKGKSSHRLSQRHSPDGGDSHERDLGGMGRGVKGAGAAGAEVGGSVRNRGGGSPMSVDTDSHSIAADAIRDDELKAKVLSKGSDAGLSLSTLPLHRLLSSKVCGFVGFVEYLVLPPHPSRDAAYSPSSAGDSDAEEEEEESS
eukprot:Tamp_16428.p1 GENE.Tamp_16428~~Tamp_16428.p1  ORF type:complete len:296 (+),score=22.94 Tamp_16428:530-1417(+)